MVHIDHRVLFKSKVDALLSTGEFVFKGLSYVVLGQKTFLMMKQILYLEVDVR